MIGSEFCPVADRGYFLTKIIFRRRLTGGFLKSAA
jgi:hypothetical protein